MKQLTITFKEKGLDHPQVLPASRPNNPDEEVVEHHDA